MKDVLGAVAEQFTLQGRVRDCCIDTQGTFKRVNENGSNNTWQMGGCKLGRHC